MVAAYMLQNTTQKGISKNSYINQLHSFFDHSTIIADSVIIIQLCIANVFSVYIVIIIIILLSRLPLSQILIFESYTDVHIRMQLYGYILLCTSYNYSYLYAQLRTYYMQCMLALRIGFIFYISIFLQASAGFNNIMYIANYFDIGTLIMLKTIILCYTRVQLF